MYAPSRTHPIKKQQKYVHHKIQEVCGLAKCKVKSTTLHTKKILTTAERVGCGESHTSSSQCG